MIKKIRNKLAMFLCFIAEKLCTEPRKVIIPPVDEYIAKQAAVAVGICKKDIKKYKHKNGIKSYRKAKACLILEIKSGNVKSIFETVKDLIEVRLYRDGEYTVVDSRLNVYAPEEETDHTEG